MATDGTLTRADLAEEMHREIGLSPDHAARLQAIAWRVATSGGHCGQ